MLASGVGGHEGWNVLGVLLLLSLAEAVAGRADIPCLPNIAHAKDRGGAFQPSRWWPRSSPFPTKSPSTTPAASTAKLELGVLTALLADVTAYPLQAHDLTRLTSRVFSAPTTNETAVGALLGLAALEQRIHPAQRIGIAAVCLASAAAMPRALTAAPGPRHPCGAPILSPRPSEMLNGRALLIASTRPS